MNKSGEILRGALVLAGTYILSFLACFLVFVMACGALWLMQFDLLQHMSGREILWYILSSAGLMEFLFVSKVVGMKFKNL